MGILGNTVNIRKALLPSPNGVGGEPDFVDSLTTHILGAILVGCIQPAPRLMMDTSFGLEYCIAVEADALS
jgi:hypothetical protein